MPAMVAGLNCSTQRLDFICTTPATELTPLPVPHTVCACSVPFNTSTTQFSTNSVYSIWYITVFDCCNPPGLQVAALESATRSGGAFNQPQYLHLKEALQAVVMRLDALQLSGDARAMRRQMIDRALAGQDR